MAYSDKDIVITPNKGSSTDDPKINFTGGSASGVSTISVNVYDVDNGTLSFDGTAGQLFSITNNLTSGSIFSVNDVSGIPSIDVNADGTVQLAPFGSTELVGIGVTNPTVKLDVNGDALVSGSVGIGTTLASQPLDINGNIRLRGALYDNSNIDGVSGQVLVSTGSGVVWADAGTTVGIATNADLFDGLDSTQFVRSDVFDRKTSGSLRFDDSVQAQFGTDGELQIYYNGTDSFIDQTGTGALIIRNLVDDADVVIQTDDGSGNTTPYFLADGSTGQVKLYQYGVEKFQTTADGILVNSNVGLGTTAGDPDQVIADFRTQTFNTSILKIVEGRDVDGTSWTSAYTRIQKTIDVTDQAYIQFNGDGNTYGMEFGSAVDNELFAKFVRNGAAELYHDGNKKFETIGAGVSVYGNIIPSDTNIKIGDATVGQALFSTGTCNFLAGQNAGCCLSSGDNNVFLGRFAGRCNTNGKQNVFIGDGAGAESTGGIGNFAGGYCAGHKITNGFANVFLGGNSGYNSTGGFNNIFGGYASGYCNTDGARNVFLGYNAGYRNQTGEGIVAVGWNAGYSNETGCNVFLGTKSGYGNNSGSGVVFIGNQAGYCNTSQSGSVAIGATAGRANRGNDNIYLGREAGWSSTRGTSVFVTGSNNFFAGVGAGGSVTTGTENIFLGKFAGAGSGIVNSSYDIFIGSYAGGIANANSNGCNIYIGLQAGAESNGGGRNIFLGNDAGCCVQSNTSNTIMIGCRAGAESDGFSNILMGNIAGRFLDGNNNQFLGDGSGSSVVGDYNIAIGSYAGGSLGTANRNIFLGYESGDGQTAGSCNIAIGSQVALPNLTGNNQLAIGSGSNHWIDGDSSFNIGIGTYTPSGAADPNNTKILNAGIVTANFYYGDGSNLSGVAAAGGGGGDGSDFNTGLSTTKYHSAANDIDGATAIGVSFPSTAGKTYLVPSIHITNVSTGDLYITSRIDYSGGENVPITNKVLVPYQGALEIIDESLIANPSDHLRFAAYAGITTNAAGVSNGLDCFVSYEEKDDTNYIGTGSTIVDTIGGVGYAQTVFTSTTNPSVINTLLLTNYSDLSDVDVSVSIYRGGTIQQGYLVYNLTVPQNSSVQILPRSKRLNASDTIVVNASAANIVGVNIAGKYIV